MTMSDAAQTDVQTNTDPSSQEGLPKMLFVLLHPNHPLTETDVQAIAAVGPSLIYKVEGASIYTHIVEIHALSLDEVASMMEGYRELTSLFSMLPLHVSGVLSNTLRRTELVTFERELIAGGEDEEST